MKENVDRNYISESKLKSLRIILDRCFRFVDGKIEVKTKEISYEKLSLENKKVFSI